MAEDDERKTHIFRVIGKTEEGDDPDSWLDLERFDEIEIKEGSGQDFQRTRVKLEWYSDSSGQEPNPARKTKTLKVIPPEEDKENPSLWFEVEINSLIAVMDDDQLIKIRFDNSEENTARKIKVRRVPHYDTPAIDEAYPDGGIIPRAEYEKDRDTKDAQQYLDVEFIRRWNFTGYKESAIAGATERKFDHHQRWRIDYNNDALIAQFDEPETAYGEGEINPPWRLDPLQNIINVQYETPPALLISLSSGGGYQGHLTTSDGVDYQEEPLDEANEPAMAASGLGWTVVTSMAGGFAGDLVAFGNPADGDACFIVARWDGAIERGVLDDDGELVWSVVGAAPIVLEEGDLLESVSFAGGAFFVSVNKWQTAESHLMVSFNGEAFTNVGNTFPGVAEASVGAGEDPESLSLRATSGAVAYNEDIELYVRVGVFRRHWLDVTSLDEDPEEDFPLHEFGDNFMWATSPDGLSWSPGFDLTETAGIDPTGHGSPGGTAISMASNLTFGNGVFVAAGAYKHAVAVPDEEQIYTDIYHHQLAAAAAIVSTDGEGWTTIQMPDQSVYLNYPSTDENTGASWGVSVQFVKRKIDEQHDGFFILSSNGLNNPFSLFYSIDGYSWEAVYETGFIKTGWAMSLFNKRALTDQSKVVYV